MPDILEAKCFEFTAQILRIFGPHLGLFLVYALAQRFIFFPYIFATQCRRPLISQTLNYFGLVLV